LNFGVSKGSIKTSFFDIQDLSAKRQDRLVFRIATANCRTASRVTLNDVNFRKGRVARRTVAKLSWHSTRFQKTFSSGCFSCFSGSHSSGRCLNCFSNNFFGGLRVPLQPVTQLIVNDFLGEGFGFSVSKLGFGLALKLGLRKLDGNNGS
jgi:hypothetical protein